MTLFRLTPPEAEVARQAGGTSEHWGWIIVTLVMLAVVIFKPGKGA